MASHTIFTISPFELGDVPLASLVPDVRYPNQDALTVLKTLPQDAYTKRPQADFSGQLSSDKRKPLRIQLTKLLSFSLHASNSDKINIKAQQGWIYELNQPKTLFKELCEQEQVRTWLREGLESQMKSYFVVGQRTFEDATVAVNQQTASTMGVGGSTFVKKLVQANSSIDLGDSAEAKAKVKFEKVDLEEGSFKVLGERVYALEYREIILKKKTPDDPSLSKDNIWRFYSDVRAADGEEPAYEDYEITLSDDLISDIGQYESIEDVDGEVLSLPSM